MSAEVHSLFERFAPVAPPLPPAIDPGTLRQLALLAAHGKGGAHPSDVALARELTRILALPPRSYAVALRLSLISQLFTEVLADPHLPQHLHDFIERLRFPLIRIALADDRFFAEAAHPARVLVARAAAIGALALVTTAAGRQQTQELIAGISDQLALSASLLDPDLRRLRPLPDAVITSYLEQQRDDAALRREAVELRTRRVAAQELETQMLGRRLPAGVVGVLRRGWVSMMAAQLRRGGMHGQGWDAGSALLVRLLALFDAPSCAPAELRRLLEQASAALREAGLHPTRVQRLMDDLRQALPRPLRAAVTVAPSPPSAAAAVEPAPVEVPAALPDDETALLKIVLVPEHWFRVFDAKDERTLWLKVSRFFPQQDRVGFTGFDAERGLSLRASQFKEDLLAGRAEAIGPSDRMQRALQALRQRKAARHVAH